MSISRSTLLLLLTVIILPFGGCASLQRSEPIQVIMAGVEPLQGQELELRMLVKLRIQNPNDIPLDFNGVYVQMDVQGKPFATGVSDASGSVPRYGEAIINVPVSVSAFRVVHQAIGIMSNQYHGKIAYELNGKLFGRTFDSVRFKSKGEFILPADIFESDK